MEARSFPEKKDSKVRPDYSGIHKRLETLLEAGHADEVLTWAVTVAHRYPPGGGPATGGRFENPSSADRGGGMTKPAANSSTSPKPMPCLRPGINFKTN